MTRTLLVGGAVALALGAAIWRAANHTDPPVRPFEPPPRAVELAPVCPWRNPDADLPRAFPGANRFESNTRILSGLRIELSQRLGRPPLPEEHALTTHQVYRDAHRLGTVLVRRVKGQYGSIEVVVAVSPDGAVQETWIQRSREPATFSASLNSLNWLDRFKHRTHDRGWDSNDVQDLPGDARESAQAIRAGIHALLVLLATADGSNSTAAATSRP